MRAISPLLKRHLLSVVLMTVLWGVFFAPQLAGQYIYLAGDLQDIYYPLESEYARAQHEWRLPEWSPYFGFGQPLLAWGQLGFFTPLHMLLRTLYVEPLWLLQLSMALYFLLGLSGMYLFLQRRVSPAGAAVGSLVFVFSGFHIGHLIHINFYTATMLVPWLLLGVDLFLLRPTARSAAMIGLAGAAIALSGQPQVVLYSYMIAAIYACAAAVWHIKSNAARQRYFLHLAIFGALAATVAILLSAFALLPLKEFLPLTDRNSALSVEELLDFSYPPFHAITLLLPSFFGDKDHYWGSKSFQELSAFIGIIPLGLASLGLFSTHAQRHKGLYIAGALLLVLGVLGALGKYSPLYAYLVDHGYLTTLTVPARFLFMFTTGIALLSALGMHYLEEIQKRSLGLVARALLLPVLVLLPFASALRQEALRARLTTLLQAPGVEVLLTLGGLLLLVVFLAPRFNFSKNTLVQYAVIVLSGATLVAYGWDYYPRTSAALLQAASPVDPHLERYRKNHAVPPRLYSRSSINLTQLPRKTYDAFKHDTSRNVAARVRHVQVVSQASSAQWVGALAIRNFRDFVEVFFANDDEQIDGDGIDVTKSQRKIFDVAGVTHVVSAVPKGAPEKVSENNYTLLEISEGITTDIHMYENPTAFPKATLIFNAETIMAADDTRARMIDDEDFDPRHLVLLSGPAAPTMLPTNKSRPYEAATVTRYEPTRVTVQTNANEAAVVMVNDASTPQWQTTIDGRPAPYYVAYSVFKAAIVPPGAHTVEFIYRSPAVTTSRYLMLLGLGVAALALLWPHKKKVIVAEAESHLL